MELRRKVIGIPLEKAAQSGDGSLLVRGKFTSDQKDEVGDIITRSATERALPKYRRWGNIRYMHQPRPVGRVTRIGVEDGLDWNEVEIDVIDPQAKFEVENGLLQALSVGILISFEDLEFLEDGGWIINDYQLAEISLVDHPANYDAALDTLNLSLDESLRNQIREQGVVPVLRSIGMVPAQKGEPMDKNTPVEPVEEQPVVEQEVSSEPVVEEPVAEPVAEEAPVVEASEEPTAEAAPVEPEAQPEPKTAEDALAEMFSSLTSAIEALQRQFEAFAERQQSPEPTADVEGQETKDISGSEDKVAQLEKKVADLSSELETLRTPVDRKGALPVEEAPAEETPEQSEETVTRKLSLKDAVGEYLKAKTAR